MLILKNLPILVTIMSFIGIIIFIAIVAIFIAGAWKTYEKCGRKGWNAIIPIYNMMVLAEITGKKSTYGLFTLIPYIGIVFQIILSNRLSKSFGKGVGMTILLVFGIGWLILGFGSDEYIGPNGESTNDELGDHLISENS